jgi:hypothetical protein
MLGLDKFTYDDLRRYLRIGLDLAIIAGVLKTMFSPYGGLYLAAAATAVAAFACFSVCYITHRGCEVDLSLGKLTLTCTRRDPLVSRHVSRAA